MIFKIHNVSLVDAKASVSIRCPSCRQQGTFDSITQHDANVIILEKFEGEQRPRTVTLGQRKCPNPQCRAHVFFGIEAGEVTVTYPTERIDFDSTSIPEPVVAALEESIICHSQRCFTAAAIMVRKTLEELCRDRGAQGNNLKERLTALGSKVVLPQELLEALDDLRLLGNDAAHIESTAYDEVGQEEVEIGLEVAKEVLKAVYQYTALLGRLRSLKRR